MKRAILVFIYSFVLFPILSFGQGVLSDISGDKVCNFENEHVYQISYSGGYPDCELANVTWSITPASAAETWVEKYDMVTGSGIGVYWDPAFDWENQPVTISAYVSFQSAANGNCGRGSEYKTYTVIYPADVNIVNGQISGPTSITDTEMVTFSFSADEVENLIQASWQLDGISVSSSLVEYSTSFSHDDNGAHTITFLPANECTQHGVPISFNFNVNIAEPPPPPDEPCSEDIFSLEGLTFPRSPAETGIIRAGCDLTITSRQSIVIGPGMVIEAGANVEFIVNSGALTDPSDDENMNWVKQSVYDENGNVIGESKSFFNAHGRSLQSQVKNLTENHVIASQVLYDELGSPVISTLPAPIFNTDFNYKEDFVTNESSTSYDFNNFDVDRNNPDPVGEDFGTLGWYYSASNDIEPFTPVTDYPYARSWTEEGPDPDIAASAAPGDVHRMGSGHESSVMREFVTGDDELTQYYNWKELYFIGEDDVALDNIGVGYKTTSTNPDGKQSVVYTDASGNTLISAVDNGAGWDYAYNYFDNAGRLIVSIPPKGVASGNPNNYKSTYTYNHLGWLLSSSTPDEGMSEYVYSRDGKIRFSQNQLQRESNPQRFSYTLYDRSGRLIESGEYKMQGTGCFVFENHTVVNPGANSIHEIVDENGAAGALDAGRCIDVSKITYDLPDANCPEPQQFLAGRMASTSNDNVTSWYSYDYQGRLVWMIQDIAGLGIKKVSYEYDFLGKLIYVRYQEGETDAFTHHYEYDADQRLSQVYTSAAGGLEVLQSSYDYYLHGPVKRVELGTDVQGIDFIYTAQGWLKAINHGDPANDPGQDGMEEGSHAGFKPDAFGMTLEYYDNPLSDDYTGAGYAGGDYNMSIVPDLYSGAIKGIGWHNPNDNHQQSIYGYGYDNKYQLSSATFGTATTVGSTYNFTDAVGKYKMSMPVGYDRHGNIQSLKRTDGRIDPETQTTTEITNYNYNYTSNSNRLESVGHNGSNFLTYTYNSIGQMTSQTEGGQSMYVTYNAYGLVTGVYADPSPHSEPIVLFDYDDKGFRLAKHVYNESSQEILATWYVRDAGGNLLATYTEDIETGTPVAQTEVPVYASGRLGIYKPDQQLYMYEVTDHLGNVRAVVIDNPFTLEFLATLENDDRRAEENQLFYNIEETAHMDDLFNHTPDEAGVDNRYSAWLNPMAAGGKSMGPGFVIPLNPGDEVDIEVYAQYASAANNQTISPEVLVLSLATGFGYDIANESTYYILDMFSDAATALGALENPYPDKPTAYIEYLFFDQNMNYDRSGHDFIGDTNPGVWDKLDFDGNTFVADKPGFLYVSIVNSSNQNVNVYFDDLKITLTESPVVVGNDYYPFGMPIADRSYERQDYRFDYQGQFSEKDDETGWNAFQYRMYDARIGRWNSIDPLKEYYSPYVGMGNNPIYFGDIDGRGVIPSIFIINFIEIRAGSSGEFMVGPTGSLSPISLMMQFENDIRDSRFAFVGSVHVGVGSGYAVVGSSNIASIAGSWAPDLESAIGHSVNFGAVWKKRDGIAAKFLFNQFSSEINFSISGKNIYPGITIFNPVAPSWGEGLLGYVDYSYTGSYVNSDGIFEYDELTDELLANFGLKLSDIEIAHEQIKKIRNQAYNIPTKAAAVTANIFLQKLKAHIGNKVSGYFWEYTKRIINGRTISKPLKF